ncbi:MAG: hypothetical protein ABL903_14600 [Methylococcales bacterium]
MTKLYNIKISQGVEFSLDSELYSILERLLPVKFIVDDQSEIDTQGVIFRNAKGNENIVLTTPSLSLLSLTNAQNIPQELETEVMFADEMDVPFPFRGRKVRTMLMQIGAVLSVSHNEKVLASSEQGPIWSVSEIDGIKSFRSALALPYISTKQNFNDVFNGGCFLEMLVLLEFIREISSDTVYYNAPLRASFIIDDPNLHWSSYGFFDYREIVRLSTKENFHVSFATIPLDTWYTHSSTADIFRENPQRISLLIHGNNHAKEELGLSYSEESRNALLGQAIYRVKRLEKKSKVPVCRVMVPPHGACSNNMLATLPKCGFESACISAGSLRFHNPDRPWVKTLGFLPSEIIEGCPVLPRWGLTGNVENTLLVAAYLGQPMILRGHHQDLKSGGGKFIEFARFINSLGSVFWSNMTDLSRLNYQWRMDGTIARIKPFGRNIMFRLPKGAAEIIIDNSEIICNDAWQIVSVDGKQDKIKPNERFLVSELIGRQISIELNVVSQPFVPLKDDFNPTPVRLILRRLLTETRDRMMWG